MIQPPVSRTAGGIGESKPSAPEKLGDFASVKMRTEERRRHPSVGAQAMPGHTAQSRVVLPCCGSEPRTNHGQMIKRPVTHWG